MDASMKAVVIERPGPPEVLRLRERPVPKSKSGWALIRVRAFGLNPGFIAARLRSRPRANASRHAGFQGCGQ